MRVIAQLEDFKRFVDLNGGDLDALITQAQETAAPAPYNPTVGDKVKVFWPEDGEYYPAVVKRVGRKAGTWVIDWDEPGNPDYTCKAEDIKPRRQAKPKPKAPDHPVPKQGTVLIAKEAFNMKGSDGRRATVKVGDRFWVTTTQTYYTTNSMVKVDREKGGKISSGFSMHLDQVYRFFSVETPADTPKPDSKNSPPLAYDPGYRPTKAKVTIPGLTLTVTNLGGKSYYKLYHDKSGKTAGNWLGQPAEVTQTVLADRINRSALKQFNWDVPESELQKLYKDTSFRKAIESIYDFNRTNSDADSVIDRKSGNNTFTEETIRQAAQDAALEDVLPMGWAGGDIGKNPFEWLTPQWKVYELGRWLRKKGWPTPARAFKIKVTRKNYIDVGPVQYIFEESLQRHRATTSFIVGKVTPDKNVGRTWQGDTTGTNTVKELINHLGHLTYVITNDIYKHGELLPVDDLEKRIHWDTENIKSRQAAREKINSEEAEDVKRRSLNGFTKGMDPKRRGTVEKVLLGGRGVMVNKVPYAKIVDALEDLAAKGYTVEDFGDRRVFFSPNGTYLEAKALGGKAGLDYVAYLHTLPFAQWTHKPKSFE